MGRQQGILLIGTDNCSSGSTTAFAAFHPKLCYLQANVNCGVSIQLATRPRARIRPNDRRGGAPGATPRRSPVIGPSPPAVPNRSSKAISDESDETAIVARGCIHFPIAGGWTACRVIGPGETVTLPASEVKRLPAAGFLVDPTPKQSRDPLNALRPWSISTSQGFPPIL
jgi:hypothetical protein